MLGSEYFKIQRNVPNVTFICLFRQNFIGPASARGERGSGRRCEQAELKERIFNEIQCRDRTLGGGGESGGRSVEAFANSVSEKSKQMTSP